MISIYREMRSISGVIVSAVSLPLSLSRDRRCWSGSATWLSVSVFGHEAPTKCREDLLRQAIGWQLQAAAQAGLSATDRRRLHQGSSPSLAAGSHLIRVWRGETHQVMVLDNGFTYAGQHWRSLTAIARAITGTAWSGPVFFGLKA